MTQAVTDKEAATPDAAQVQRDAILAGEVLEWGVDKAPPRKRWDEDREPTVTCLVAHRELKLKVRWCASREALTDDEQES